mmetsp:Transcript_22777/g.53977  ORF Transcript_22777/g.53977 Transcript_22777/m.53977 type:complete len:693 (-) Transcript_22777:142-2220(-)
MRPSAATTAMTTSTATAAIEILLVADQQQQRGESSSSSSSSLPSSSTTPQNIVAGADITMKNNKNDHGHGHGHDDDHDYENHINRRRYRSRSRSRCRPRSVTSHRQQWWWSTRYHHNQIVMVICWLCVLFVAVASSSSSSSPCVLSVEAFEVPTRSTHVFSSLPTTSSSSTATTTTTIGRRGLCLTPTAPTTTTPASSSSSSSTLNLWPKHLFFDSLGGATTKKKKKGSSGLLDTRKSTSKSEEYNNDNGMRHNNNAAAVSAANTVPEIGGVDPPLASLVDVSSQFRLAKTDEDVIEKLDVGQRLICVGDVHGDIEALVKALEVAKVYDRQSNSWIGGNTIVVQTGDILDRGTEELACYSLLAKLSQEAPPVGGRVVLLAGNHEIMNAIGNFDYVTHDQEFESSIGRTIDETLQSTTTPSTPDGVVAQMSQLPPPQWRIQYGGNHPARWSCFEPGGGLLVAPLMSNMKVAFQVGKTVCVHAGLRPDHIQENGGIAGMNRAYRDWILMNNNSNNQKQQQQANNKDDGYNYVDTIASDATTARSPIRYNHQGRYNSNEELYVEVQGRYLYYQRSLPPFLNDPKGPIWMRDYSSPSGLPPKEPLPTQTMLETTLNELNANRMVMGHTIQKQINAVMDGKAWRVDIGMSAGCGGGRPEVLEIVGVSESGGERVSVLTEDGEITASDRFVQTYASMM